MAEPVRARRLTDQEGQRLQQIVRRGKHGSVRVRRAMIIMASSSGTLVPAIARLVAADEDTVRDVIHAFNAKGLAALDPQWAGGRPRLISDEAIEVIVAAATTRPEKPVQPFTRWSLRKLAAYLAGCPRPVVIGRERLRQILHARGISFQRTRTWKESRDPDRDAKLDRIEYVTSAYPDRCFAFDQFGPLSIRPCHGTCWAKRKGSNSTGRGNPYLSAAVGEAAISTGRTQSFPGAGYRRLAKRMPKKKALVTVGNSMLTSIHALLADPDASYHDLGADYYEQRMHVRRQARNHIWSLERLGYKVTIQATANDPGPSDQTLTA